ncbi:cysteine-rich CWC family protein [Neptuniibacter sp. QD29_5]|uniref:cysteine-rich CWC family protein n=1 Tax=Neptuniibacter sp. QD29_5 TaxID=3398207 RepID=UPI0039F61E46
MPQHEQATCPMCGSLFECKVGSYFICYCSEIHLTREQAGYLAERWDECLCCKCLNEFKENWGNIPDSEK